MRVALLGGTRFIGRAVLAELLARGHDPLVIHRGRHEPDDLPEVPHLHVDRERLAEESSALERFAPEAVIDLFAMTAKATEPVVAAFPADLPMVTASSMDVYRAFGAVLSGEQTDAVPIDERSPVRDVRYPYRGRDRGGGDRGMDLDLDRYDKLDVEEIALARGAIVVRLPIVYGEHDTQRREWPVLARARAGRRRIPVGAANSAWSRGYVGDVARGLVQAAEAGDAVRGEVFNLCEERTPPAGLWVRRILAAAGAADIELVRVPEDLVPADLIETRAHPQPMIVSAAKARERLGWRESDPEEALRRSVAWHLEHPSDTPFDPAADDAALAAA
jgi:nucleoside-diphosphate-sugar epimerase